MQAPHPIRNETEYRAALAVLSRFFDSNPDAASQESSDYHEALAALVERSRPLPHKRPPIKNTSRKAGVTCFKFLVF